MNFNHFRDEEVVHGEDQVVSIMISMQIIIMQVRMMIIKLHRLSFLDSLTGSLSFIILVILACM